MAINYLAVGVCTVVAVVLGGIWYSPKVFGDKWAAHVGQADQKPTPEQRRRAMILFTIGMFLMAFVLAHNILAFSPTDAHGAPTGWRLGLYAGIAHWAGFVIPVQLGVTGFELKKWGYLGIGAGFQLVNLSVMGIILAEWT